MENVERLAEKLKVEKGWIIRLDGDEIIAPGARLADLADVGKILKESGDYLDDGCLSRFAIIETKEGVFITRQDRDLEGTVTLFIYPARDVPEASSIFKDALSFLCVRTVMRAMMDLGLHSDMKEVEGVIRKLLP